jgi:RNA polymerase sigma factor (sigma-70 family)
VRGTAQAVETLLRAIGPQIRLMVAARLPGRYHDLEELTQLVLVALHDALPRLERPTVAGLKAYLSGIVTRKVADHLRRRGGGDLVGPAWPSLDSTVMGLSGASPLWQLLSAAGTSPPSAAAQADQFARLMEELGKLKADYREVVTLAFFDQLPTRDIAERMRLTRPAASMLLLRALRTLRRNLTGSSEVGQGEPA